MNLSNNLISEFAKLTKTNEQSSSESTVNGTIVEYNGAQYVKLDGSDLLTPVKKTTSINSGERVMVMIKDHTATVIGNLSSPSVGTTDLTKVENKITDVEILVANKVSSEELDAQVARIDSLVSDNVVIRETVSANTALVNDIKAENVTITDRLTAVEAAIDDLDVTYLEADVAEITYAKITSLNATDAKLNNLQSTYATFQTTVTDRLDTVDATIDNLDSVYATITDLATERARIDVLEADKADITQLKADIADINTLMFGSATGNVLQTSFANAVIAQLGNAQIKSAMIQSLSADKITSGNIITNDVHVLSANGMLRIYDETMQISDGVRVRVQIGKDSSNDYSINIWDADGNMMFSKGGITENAIKEAIIRDDMVSDTANISAYKLNIDSLFEAINGSTNTIKASKVYLDTEKQSLDIAFTTMTFDIDTLNQNVSSQGTQISAVQGQIESKIWQTDIDASIYDITVDITELNTQYSDLKQTTDSISATVASHTSELGGKADQVVVKNLIERVSTVELNQEGFETMVSETYATIDDVDGLAGRVSAAESSITQNKDSITAAVKRISNNETSITNLKITDNTMISHIQTVETTANNAKTTAETANTNASLAQVAADEAQTSADKAQESADDNNERIGQAETLIQQLSDSISVMVVDESGESLMTQDGDRWIFSMGSYNETLNKVSSGLNDLVSNVGDTQNTVTVLQQAVDDLGVLSDYIKITTYNDQPCIELGEYDSDFKLRITNTEIQFVEGTSVPAYLSNQKLYIEKAEITGELQQGGFVWSSRSNGNLGLIWKGVNS